MTLKGLLVSANTAFKLLKLAGCRLHIAKHAPGANLLGFSAAVFYKAGNIGRRIPQKQANLVWKIGAVF